MNLFSFLSVVFRLRHCWLGVVFAGRVPQAVWEDICHATEADFAAGRYRDGLVSAIGRISALLAEHFPAAADDNPNELGNRPRLR